MQKIKINEGRAIAAEVQIRVYDFQLYERTIKYHVREGEIKRVRERERESEEGRKKSKFRGFDQLRKTNFVRGSAQTRGLVLLSVFFSPTLFLLLTFPISHFQSHCYFSTFVFFFTLVFPTLPTFTSDSFATIIRASVPLNLIQHQFQSLPICMGTKKARAGAKERRLSHYLSMANRLTPLANRVVIN